MSEEDTTRLSTDEARGASTHDRRWLLIGLLVSAVGASGAFLFFSLSGSNTGLL